MRAPAVIAMPAELKTVAMVLFICHRVTKSSRAPHVIVQASLVCCCLRLTMRRLETRCAGNIHAEAQCFRIAMGKFRFQPWPGAPRCRSGRTTGIFFQTCRTRPRVGRGRGSDEAAGRIRPRVGLGRGSDEAAIRHLVWTRARAIFFWRA